MKFINLICSWVEIVGLLSSITVFYLVYDHPTNLVIMGGCWIGPPKPGKNEEPRPPFYDAPVMDKDVKTTDTSESDVQKKTEITLAESQLEFNTEDFANKKNTKLIKLGYPKFMQEQISRDQMNIVSLSGVGQISYSLDAEFNLSETFDLPQITDEDLQTFHNQMLKGFKDFERIILEENIEYTIGGQYKGLGFTTFQSFEKTPRYMTCTTHVLFAVDASGYLAVFSSYLDYIEDEEESIVRSKVLAHHKLMIQKIYQKILDSFESIF